MPQSLACAHLHVIFSTKDRAASIPLGLQSELHAYIATVIKNLGCYPEIINSMPDHIHILAGLGRSSSMSNLVKDAKTASSKWIKARDSRSNTFAWQSGYAAFAVSVSNVEEVRIIKNVRFRMNIVPF
jgi:REP element-mobilizing transposase RayT